MSKKKILAIIGGIVLVIVIIAMIVILIRPEVLQQSPLQDIFPTPTPTYKEMIKNWRGW